MCSAQWLGEPGYSSLIVRKNFPMLKKADGLIPRSHDWWAGTAASWNGTDKIWTFPAPGGKSTIEFGHMANEGDEYNYKGAAYHNVNIDQAEDFGTATQPRYLMSRIRRKKGSTIPGRFRITFNPGGAGHEWIQETYIPEEYDDLRDQKVWWKDTLGEDGKTRRAGFVFATLMDNPSLDAEEYTETLFHLAPHIRRMLLDGDWSAAMDGDFFKREWFRIVDIRPNFTKRARYWDLGASDNKDSPFTAGVRIGITPAKRICFDHCVRGQWTTGTRDEVILNTAKMDGTGTAQIFEQEPGSGGKAQIATIRHKLRGFRVIARVKRIKKEVDWGPLASWGEAEGIDVAAGDWNRAFIDELTSLPKGRYKDQADAAAGGFQMLGAGRRRRVRIRERRRHR